MMLLKIHGVGGQKVRKILELVVDVDKSVYNFAFLKKLSISVIQKNISSGKLTESIWKKYRSQVIQEWEQSKSLKITIISYFDKAYPQRLLKLKYFPVILYTKGNLKLLNATKSVGIVGTRTPSEEGVMREIELTSWFVEQDFVIVSGLAQGCDTYAHQTAKLTIAVLAHGLDQPIYPPQNAQLAEKILSKGGLLVSTYPLGRKLIPQYLVARDEWQSGLSDGIVVVETGLTGGTHATVNFALKQSRPVAVLEYQQYCDSNLGNEKYLASSNFFSLTNIDTWIKFVEKISSVT